MESGGESPCPSKFLIRPSALRKFAAAGPRRLGWGWLLPWHLWASSDFSPPLLSS